MVSSHNNRTVTKMCVHACTHMCARPQACALSLSYPLALEYILKSLFPYTKAADIVLACPSLYMYLEDFPKLITSRSLDFGPDLSLPISSCI